MARPTKEGLEYFPLVTNFEDKVILLIAEFGASGVGIVVSLYQKIYNNGYYINWNDDSLMLFSRYVNEEIMRVNTVITRCFDRNIFDKSLYKKHGILTSHGIQKQYLKVCKEARRKQVRFIKEYCLIKDKEFLRVITELTAINAEETPVNDSDNTQSKVKESKVLKDHCPKVFSDDSLEMRMSKYMANRIKESYPGVKLPSNYNKWCLSFGRLIQIDGRTPEEIGKVIKWVYADDFWCTNIRSPDKLREKWDTLWLQMNRKQNKQQNKPIEQWTREEREAAGI